MTEVTITEDIVEANVEEVIEEDDGMEAVEVTTTNGEVSLSQIFMTTFAKKLNRSIIKLTSDVQ